MNNKFKITENITKLEDIYKYYSFVSLRDDNITYAIKNDKNEVVNINITEKVEKVWGKVQVDFKDLRIYLYLDNNKKPKKGIIKKVFVGKNKVIKEVIEHVDSVKKLDKLENFLYKKFNMVVNNNHKLLRIEKNDIKNDNKINKQFKMFFF